MSDVRWGIPGGAKFAREFMGPALTVAPGGHVVALATSNPAKAGPFLAFAPDLRVHARQPVPETKNTRVFLSDGRGARISFTGCHREARPRKGASDGRIERRASRHEGPASFALRTGSRYRAPRSPAA